jgi:hypothetical protein
MQARIDEAATRAGRDPTAIKRVVNVMALDGEPSGWADRLRKITELGFETLLVGVPDEDPLGFIRRLGEEVAPQLRGV